jgi:two-component system response regulator YesN
MHLPYEKVSETCNFLVYYLLANSDECKNIIHKMVPADSHIVKLMNSLKNTIQIVDWMMRLNDNLQQQIECNSKDFTMRLVSQAKNIIDNNLDKQLLLSDIAATLGISPSYLSTIFKKCTDRGFVDYITERKMKKAVELFLSKSLKIFEVAQLLGYDNAYYFSKVFKKQYGMSPKSFIAKRKT